MRYLARSSVLAVMALAAAGGMTGCSDIFNIDMPPKPPPIEYTLLSPYRGVRTLAVAPAVNLSGSRDFDVLAISDSLFEEMQQVQGLNVLPLNKTLAAMQRMGIRSIDTPQMAQRLAAFLGADGLVVPGITAYDPYNPPTLGMILQLYTPDASVPLGSEATQPLGLPGTTGVGADRQPVSQVAAVFNASNQTVLRELRDFAEGRTQYDSALQDEQFLVDMDAYTRFVCHAMVRRLMEVEKVRVAGR